MRGEGGRKEKSFWLMFLRSRMANCTAFVVRIAADNPTGAEGMDHVQQPPSQASLLHPEAFEVVLRREMAWF